MVSCFGGPWAGVPKSGADDAQPATQADSSQLPARSPARCWARSGVCPDLRLLGLRLHGVFKEPSEIIRLGVLKCGEAPPYSMVEQGCLRFGVWTQHWKHAGLCDYGKDASTWAVVKIPCREVYTQQPI